MCGVMRVGEGVSAGVFMWGEGCVCCYAGRGKRVCMSVYMGSRVCVLLCGQERACVDEGGYGEQGVCAFI